MTASIDGVTAAAMLRKAAETVIANEPVLTKADLAIGDGDHGIGMERGFKAALLALDKLGATPSPKAAFSAVGVAILSKAGGASGAVFGTLFQGTGKALGEEPADADGFAAALGAGADAVVARGKAKPGDKTMLDALLPAIGTLKAAGSKDLLEAVEAAAAAARQGAEATAGMIASTGRAKMLGQRSVGHVDPGALTMSFVFQGMALALREIADGS